jgi:hypothetical protein
MDLPGGKLNTTKTRITLALLTTLTTAGAAHAEKIPEDFRAEFERAFRKGRTYAVCMQRGIPTTSINGVQNDSNGTAHYSIDVFDDGNWKTSAGILDFDQTAADFLDLGEVMELADLSWKDNRVDMRMVSLEAKKVTRGSWILKTERREPVATNFKFFFPPEWKSRYLSSADVPAALDFVTTWLRPFPNEQSARGFSAQLRVGAPPPPPPSQAAPAAHQAPPPPPRPAPAKATTKREIKPGMTALEVIDILGKPQNETSFQSQSKWTYPDLTVIFDNGRVKEVRF